MFVDKDTVKNTTVAILLSFTLSVLTGCSSESSSIGDGWRVQPREIPVPDTVSEEFRQLLSQNSKPTALKYDIASALPEKLLVRLIHKRDKEKAAGIQALANQFKVSIRQEAIAGVNTYWVEPKSSNTGSRLMVYLHGGGYIANAGIAGAKEAILIAGYTGMKVLSIDYRMPPAHPAPAAMNDVIDVWRALLGHSESEVMALGGTSAGGGITLASVQHMKELGLPLPAAIYVGTPSVDLAKTGDSLYINQGIDRELVAWSGMVDLASNLYAGQYDFKHPHVSPIYGDFTGFPPTYLISGTRDLFLSSTVRAHRAIRRAGGQAELHVYEGQSHADYMHALDIPESNEHYRELGLFLDKYLQ